MCKRWKSICLCAAMSLMISFQVWGLSNGVIEKKEKSLVSIEENVQEMQSESLILLNEPELEIEIKDNSSTENIVSAENSAETDELPEENFGDNVEEDVSLLDTGEELEEKSEEEWLKSSLQDEEAMRQAFQTAPNIERFSLVSDRSALIPGIKNKPIKIAMSPTDTHMLILKEDGTVWAVGDNTRGQLGDGTNISRTIPVQAIGLTKVIDIAAGADHSIALKSDGTVWAWGANYYGQVGDNTKSNKNTPQRVKGPGDVYKLSGIIAISAGRHHNLALKEDGTVWAWGDNQYGQLGDITENPYSKRPIQMKLDNGYAPDSGEVYGDAGYIQNVQRICAGGLTSFVIALTHDEDTGTLFGCGRGRHNRLGEEFENYDLYFFHEIGARTPDIPYFVADYYYLIAPYGNTEYVAAALGGGKAFYIGKDGTVWENENYGQRPERTKKIAGLHDIICVTTGDASTAALRSDGVIFCWGFNLAGQFGIGTSGNKTETPIYGCDDYGGSFELASETPFDKVVYGVIVSPDDEDCFSLLPDASGVFQLTTDDEVDIELYDQNGTRVLFKNGAYHLKKDQQYYLKVFNDTPTAYSLSLNRVIAHLTKTARSIDSFNLAISVNGYINHYSKEEWFTFQVPSANTYRIDIGKNTNLAIGVYTVADGKRTLIKSGNEGNLEVALTPGVQYFVRVTGLGDAPEYDYILTILNSDIVSKAGSCVVEVNGGNSYTTVVKGENMLPSLFADSCFMVLYDDTQLVLENAAAQQFVKMLTPGLTQDGKIEFITIEPGMILFRCHHIIPSENSFSGFINAPKFKAITNTTASIGVYLCPLGTETQEQKAHIQMLKYYAREEKTNEEVE